ncbi:hypothetical protein M9H77_31230 [Catharanthus roseus]|uniref:Uncharacterized protein n=1 Tax=Catharanthus roseus TaxID=4058 RepID=A0ACB9ZZF7_CATRO|nr:hypothetical protein M9H77_31230 [Catharanthus roseus]
MVRPSCRRGDDDLGPVTDMTSRVEGRTVTASSRGVRGRHSTSDLPVTPTPLAPGFHHGTGEAGYSTQRLAVPFRSGPPLQPHLSLTPVPYEPYGSVHPPSHPTDTVYNSYLHASTIMRPRIPYRSATQEPILEFRRSAEADKGPADRVFEGDRVVGEEQERRGDDDGDSGDNDGDEEQTVYVTLWHQLVDRTGVLVTGKERV